VEAALALIVFFALLFLVLDAGWTLFVKATLQHAVAEGVRYGVTSQTSGGMGQVASIKGIVQWHALGLLSGDQSGKIAVRFVDAGTLVETGNNIGGNVVEVSVENYQITPLAPLLRSSTPISVTVRAADLLEPSPGGIPPSL
jgi:hypothetical protein